MLDFSSSELSQRLRSLFRLRGQTMFALDPTLVPVVTTFDASDPPYRFDGYEAFARIVSPAVVGQLSHVDVINNSKGPAVVTYARYRGGAASTLLIALRQASGPGVTNVQFRTGERSGLSIDDGEPTAVRLEQGSTAVALTTAWADFVLGTGDAQINGLNWTIPAGMTLRFQAQLVNTALTMSLGVQVFENPPTP